MLVQGVITFIYVGASIVHLVLFSQAPHSESPGDLWDNYTSTANYINLLLGLFFLWVGVRGALSSFLDSCCDAVIFGHLLILAMIWCAVGCVCLLYSPSAISDASSLFWTTSLFYSATSVSALFHSTTLGLTPLCRACCCSFGSFLLTYATATTFFSCGLTIAISFQPDALFGIHFHLTYWSFLTTALLCLLLALFYRHSTSPALPLSIGFLRLKRILLSILQIVALQGPINFGFYLSSSPTAFTTHTGLACLYLCQCSVVVPIFYVYLCYSTLLDTPVLTLFYSNSLLLLQSLSPVIDSFTI